MTRRIVGFLALISLVMALNGCYSVDDLSIAQLPPERPLNVKAIVTTKGTRYEFEEMKTVSGTSGSYGIVTDTSVWGYLKGGEYFHTSLSNVRTLSIEQIDVTGTVVFSVVAAGTIAAIVVASTSSNNNKTPAPNNNGSAHCCPFVYSYDGSLYMLDGEPLGGAICPGLERTDLCQLRHLRPVNGEYRLLLRNELDETQYIDEFTLLAVDHSPGVQVVPDGEGVLHGLRNPVPPTKAIDTKGGDITRWLRESDDYIWDSDIASKDPAQRSDLRDSIVLTFPRPRNSATAALLVNGGTAIWGSRMIMRMTEIRGKSIPGWYESMKSREGQGMIAFWDNREEILRLQVRVRVGNEWVTRGFIRGNGPFVIEEREIPLQLDGVKGDSLTILLTPPAGFWQLNRVAVCYGEEDSVEVHEVEAERIEGGESGNLNEILQQKDGRYYVMPVRGEGEKLSFRVPPQKPETERTVFARVAGYYDMHLTAAGDPQLEEIRRIEGEPGYPAAFAIKEFHAWKKQSSMARTGVQETPR